MEWTGFAIQCSSLRYEMIAARVRLACRRHSGARDDRLRVQPAMHRACGRPRTIGRAKFRDSGNRPALAGSAATI